MNKLHLWSKSRTPVLILFIVIYAMLSINAMQRFSWHSAMGNNPDARAAFNNMITGTAWKPFVYRVLVPWTVRVIVDATPQAIQNHAAAGLHNSTFAYLLGRTDLSYPRAVLGVVLYSCLCGYIILLYKMGEFFFPGRWAMALFMPAIGLLMIPAFSWHEMIYDFAILFLTAGCYYYMARQQWVQYFIFFALACLNKETTILVLVFFMIWHARRLDHRTFLFYVVIQSFIYLAIRLAIIKAFIFNPGTMLEHHGNLSIAAFIGDYGAGRLVYYFTLLFVLTYRWSEKPLFARYVFWIFPMMLAAYTVYGYPGELRVFYDLFPLFTILVTHTLVEGTGISSAAIFNRPEYHHASVPVD
jgi:hypothetical protein